MALCADGSGYSASLFPMHYPTTTFTSFFGTTITLRTFAAPMRRFNFSFARLWSWT